MHQTVKATSMQHENKIISLVEGFEKPHLLCSIRSRSLWNYVLIQMPFELSFKLYLNFKPLKVGLYVAAALGEGKKIISHCQMSTLTARKLACKNLENI